jgi:hypothetical protein
MNGWMMRKAKPVVVYVLNTFLKKKIIIIKIK